MKTDWLIIAAIAFLLLSNKKTTTPALAGGDKDSHGCIGSAGYIWCDKLQKCIRPWEVNC